MKMPYPASSCVNRSVRAACSLANFSFTSLFWNFFLWCFVLIPDWKNRGWILLLSVHPMTFGKLFSFWIVEKVSIPSTSHWRLLSNVVTRNMYHSYQFHGFSSSVFFNLSLWDWCWTRKWIVLKRVLLWMAFKCVMSEQQINPEPVQRENFLLEEFLPPLSSPQRLSLLKISLLRGTSFFKSCNRVT